jgi:hypothetical protein
MKINSITETESAVQQPTTRNLVYSLPKNDTIQLLMDAGAFETQAAVLITDALNKWTLQFGQASALVASEPERAEMSIRDMNFRLIKELRDIVEALAMRLPIR